MNLLFEEPEPESPSASAKEGPLRLIYTLFIIVTIITGLLSRRLSFVPLFIGDILWASLVFFLFRFICINAAVKKPVIYSLVFSFAIEFSQLYTAPWLIQIRKTVFGKLVLGAVFNWGDLLCYTAGVFIAAGVDMYFVRKNRKSTVVVIGEQ